MLVKAGTFIKLNEKLRPNSYLARSTTDDVARVEERTYICTETKEMAGPTNNWVAPDEMKKTITGMVARLCSPVVSFAFFFYFAFFFRRL